MLSSLLQPCEAHVRVLQPAVFIHPPQQPRYAFGQDDSFGDLSYITGAPPSTNDEVVRGVIDVTVPSDRTVSQLRVRLRADQVVSILDNSAAIPVSWEQSVPFDRVLTFPPPRPAHRSRTAASRTPIQVPSTDERSRSRSRSALRSFVRTSNRSRSRRGRHLLQDVVEAEVADSTPTPTSSSGAPTRDPSPSAPHHHQTTARSSPSRSRGRSVAVRPTGIALSGEDDTSSSALSTTPSSARRVSTPDSSAPDLDSSGFSRIATCALTPTSPAIQSIKRDASRDAGRSVRPISLSRLRRRARSNSNSTSGAARDDNDEDDHRSSGLLSGLFQHHHHTSQEKGKARNLSQDAISSNRGLSRDASPSVARHSIVHRRSAAESDDGSASDSEEEEEGLFLGKGVHAFEFAFVLPSDAQPYERSPYGRVKWTIKATLVGGGRARSNVEDSVEIFPIVVPTPDHYFATPLGILYHDLHPSLGLLSVSLTSQNISVGGIMNVDIHSPQPPVDMHVYLIRVTLETSIELETKRKGKQRVPTQRHRLYEQGWVPPRAGSNKFGDGDPAQGLIRSAGTDHAWSVQTTVRLPDDNLIRATTMPGSKAAIRFAHNLLVEIVHSRDPAIDAWLTNGSSSAGLPSPEQGGAERKIKVFALRQPAIIPSCCVAYNAATLPVYTRTATQPAPVQSAHHEQTHCVCGISMAELTAQQESLLPPGSIPMPTSPHSHVPGDAVHNHGKVGELPPDWQPIEKPRLARSIARDNSPSSVPQTRAPSPSPRSPSTSRPAALRSQTLPPSSSPSVHTFQAAALDVSDTRINEPSRSRTSSSVSSRSEGLSPSTSPDTSPDVEPVERRGRSPVKLGVSRPVVPATLPSLPPEYDTIFFDEEPQPVVITEF